MSAYIRVASASPSIVNVPQYFQQSIVSPSQSNIYYMDGNMGLGQAVPGSKLVVDGNCSIGFPTTPAPTNGLIVSGSVGIGKTNPETTLDVNGTIREGDANGYVILNPPTYSVDGYYTSIVFSGGGGNPFYLFKNDTIRTADGGTRTTTLRNDDGTLRLMANAGAGIVIQAGTGSVGIGKTNPATALDVNGTIKNLNPCFSAGGNVSIYTGGSIMVFQSVSVNVGNHYNSANGRFTAPIQGNYLFSVFAIKQSPGIATLDVRKNGTTFNSFNPYSYITANVDWQLVGGSGIIPLNAGDYVEVVASAGNFYGPAHNLFSGCLLG